MSPIAPNAYDSPERSKYYYNSTLPFWDMRLGLGKYTMPRPYALYSCYTVEKQLIEDIQKASVSAARVYIEAGKLLAEETPQELEVLGYTKALQRFLLSPDDEMFCMRIAWAVQEDSMKLIEVNTERPVFWIESEEINRGVAEHFGLDDPTPGTKELLQIALDQSIARALKNKKSGPELKPQVGYVVPDSSADFQTLQWLSDMSIYGGEVFTVTNLDFDKKTRRPFNRVTGKYFDALLCWYPIEEMSDLTFYNGDRLDKVLLDALEHNSFVLIHELAAFRLQPKSILAYITKNKDKIFTGHLADAMRYFPDTYLEKDILTDNYFAKPVWGRAGRGCIKVEKGDTKYGRYQETYYNKQPKVYQELLTFPNVDIDNKSLSLVYEAWVYNVDNEWVAGAIGIRASENTITDDFSYFLPVGVKKP